MVSRPSYGPSTPPPLPGVDFLAEYQTGMKGLFDAANFPLSGIGGTADDVTASLAWDLDGGTLLDGMKFTLTWTATNTGPMTLALNGGAPVNVLDATGGAMIGGAAQAGTRALLEFVGGAFRVLVGTGADAASQRFYWRFTSSGTWTKPAGLPDDTMVTVELWGAGGGGGTYGGGGGSYLRAVFRVADLPSSVAVAIGAGGSAGSVGGTGGSSTFGVLATAYGGRGGTSSSGGPGAGSHGTGAAPPDYTGGSIGGGSGTTSTGGDATAESGGGGGGGSGSGGRSVYGGAGGTGVNGQMGGVSIFGGNGGNGGTTTGTPGQAPGGGGGRNSPGARGEVRVWI